MEMYLTKNMINSNIRKIKYTEYYLNRPDNQSTDYTKEGFVSPRHKRNLLAELLELKEELSIVKDEMKELLKTNLSIPEKNTFKRKIKQIEILLNE